VFGRLVLVFWGMVTILFFFLFGICEAVVCGSFCFY
jgi:hypothetical protein